MGKKLNLIGDKYGRLEVIDYNADNDTWVCRCECGNTREVTRNKLRSGRVVECKECGQKTRKKLKIDLTGQTFGEWYVEGLSENNRWKCKCSCGTVRELTSYQLTSGRSQSCGHNTGNLKDILGQRFGKLEVIEYVSNGNWKCKCDCGKETIISGRMLRSGNTKSCGCGRGANEIDIKGQTFGEWTVLEYEGNSYWKCRCSCGTIKSVHSYTLRNGTSTNCGAPHHLIKKSLIGKRFGKLEVLEYSGNGLYKCLCDCGNTKEILMTNLVNGSTKSCGCSTLELLKDTLYNRYGDTNPKRANNPRTSEQLKMISSEQEFGAYIHKFIDEHNRLPYVADIAKLAGVCTHTALTYIRKYGFETYIDDYNKSGHSSYEAELMELFPGGEQGNKKILNGKELDIYYPDKKFAIEFNGTYWHNSAIKDRDYHQEKTIECAKQGIRLFHIFEYEWEDPATKEKIKSLLNRILNNNTTKIYARNTTIKHIPKSESDEFLEIYHLQGTAAASIRYGVYYEDELIGVMTFGEPRFNNTVEYELIRLAWKDNINVVGGFERVFSKFVQEYRPHSIVTYCDISKFTGDSYLRVGFITKPEYMTKPNYVWVRPSDNEVLSRYQTQKRTLIEAGLGDYGNTEDEIMTNLGYLKIYNCGNLRMIWNKNES